MTGLGSMRERITLMAEAVSLGAGGQQTVSTPVIASVWAEALDGMASRQAEAGRSWIGHPVSFRCHAGAGYDAARWIDWRGNRYRVSGCQLSGADRRFITFSAAATTPVGQGGAS